MNKLINEIHRRILPQFEAYLQEKNNADEPLCELSKASFIPGQLPNYEDVAHTGLYLMRYAAAYISEYYLAFKQILESSYLENRKLSVLSLGSGANLDGLAACIAIKDSGNKQKFIYHGVDKSRWPFVFTAGKSFHMINKNLDKFTVSDLCNRSTINIISFPKLLSEIRIDDMERFFNNGIASRLENKIILMFSNRHAKSTAIHRDEISKSVQIMGYLTSLSSPYSLQKEFHISGKDEKYNEIPLRNLDELPLERNIIGRDIINICDDPGKFCCRKDDCTKRESYISERSERPTTICREKIGRYPMITASYFDTHLYFMEKK